MRVRYTATAQRELDHAVDYLLEHAPTVAAAFVDSIERAVKGLLAHPYSAQETSQPGVRRKYVRRFRYGLFYVVNRDADELVIINIRHTSRQPWSSSNE
jgi:plasmid stabilization system protein ParE